MRKPANGEGEKGSKRREDQKTHLQQTDSKNAKWNFNEGNMEPANSLIIMVLPPSLGVIWILVSSQHLHVMSSLEGTQGAAPWLPLRSHACAQREFPPRATCKGVSLPSRQSHWDSVTSQMPRSDRRGDAVAVETPAPASSEHPLAPLHQLPGGNPSACSHPALWVPTFRPSQTCPEISSEQQCLSTPPLCKELGDQAEENASTSLHGHPANPGAYVAGGLVSLSVCVSLPWSVGARAGLCHPHCPVLRVVKGSQGHTWAPQGLSSGELRSGPHRLRGSLALGCLRARPAARRGAHCPVLPWSREALPAAGNVYVK